MENLKINSRIINDPIVIFLTKNNDTILFDRTNDDYFVGQILFDGIDSVLVEEGLMKTDNLEDLIEKYFNLDSEINISSVVQASVFTTGLTPVAPQPRPGPVRQRPTVAWCQAATTPQPAGSNLIAPTPRSGGCPPNLMAV